MDWMFVSLHNSYAETLIPSVMVFGDGAFERQLGHKGGALTMGLVSLWGAYSLSLPLSLLCENTARFLSANQEQGLH